MDLKRRLDSESDAKKSVETEKSSVQQQIDTLKRELETERSKNKEMTSIKKKLENELEEFLVTKDVGDKQRKKLES
jgi:signal recognition particle GTPase